MSNTPRRRWLLPAVLLALLIALFVWWQRRDASDVADDRGGQGERASGGPSARTVIAGTDQGEVEAARMRWQGTTAAINGRVSDESGKPIASAEVCVMLEG